MDIATIEQQALQLPLKARAVLAHKLLQSLDNLEEAETEQPGLDEAESRAEKIDAGLVQMVPSDVVSRKARALLL